MDSACTDSIAPSDSPAAQLFTTIRRLLRISFGDGSARTFSTAGRTRLFLTPSSSDSVNAVYHLIDGARHWLQSMPQLSRLGLRFWLEDSGPSLMLLLRRCGDHLEYGRSE